MIVHQILNDNFDLYRGEDLVPVQTDSEYVDGPSYGMVNPIGTVGSGVPSDVPPYNEPPAYDAPPAYDVPPGYDDMNIMPSAPTESFGGPPPGTVAAPATDYPMATAPPGYNEGGGLQEAGDEVKEFLMGIGKVYYDEYYELFMNQGFDSMDLIKTLSDEDLKNEKCCFH